MRSKTTTAVGALHPVLFFAGVYVVVLLFSIFICSTIFYSCNTSKTELVKKSGEKEQQPSADNTATGIASVR
jgi:hypothetical protein